jgi:transposase
MALSYLPVDRDQAFLLPPDMRDWLSPGHLVWFVLDVIERVDTSALHERHPRDGVGRRAYNPEMLLALLVYAYSGGIRSSRQIERLCEVDVAFRVICANHVPDHTTIARFRQDHQPDAIRLFVDVLALCAAAGLTTVGLIAVDGTKIAANASLKANRTREQLEAEVAAMFTDAADIDAEEDTLFGGGRGDELPAELVDPRSRKARLDAAVAEVTKAEAAWQAEQQRAQQAQARRAEHGHGRPGPPPKGAEIERAEQTVARLRARAAQRHAAAQAAAAARGERKPRGPAPGAGKGVRQAEQRLADLRVKAEAAPAQPSRRTPRPRREPARPQANTTDVDSRIMKAPGGWVQGYNAQAAVNEHGVVIAADVTQDGNDVQQCHPMMAATQANLHDIGVSDPIQMMLFDAGYLSDDNLTADGPDRLIATGKAHRLHRAEPTSGDPTPDASPIAAMDHRLRTPEGRAAYSHRQHIVEPVFGTIKEQRGFRRFSRRGLDAVRAEWQLVTATHNLFKLFNHGPTPA